MRGLRVFTGQHGHKFVFMAFAVLAAGCLIGETMQSLLVGPDFIRFHLSDFCTVGAECSTVLIVGSVFFARRPWRTDDDKSRTIFMLTFATTIATVYWCFDEITFEESTDWIDVVAFALGGVVCYGLTACLHWCAQEEHRVINRNKSERYYATM